MTSCQSIDPPLRRKSSSRDRSGKNVGTQPPVPGACRFHAEMAFPTDSWQAFGISATCFGRACCRSMARWRSLECEGRSSLSRTRDRWEAGARLVTAERRVCGTIADRLAAWRTSRLCQRSDPRKRAEDWALLGRVVAGLLALVATVWAAMITVGALGSRTPEEILSTADLILYAGFIRACSAFLKAGRRRLWIMTCAVAGTLPFYLRGRDLYGFAEFGPSRLSPGQQSSSCLPCFSKTSSQASDRPSHDSLSSTSNRPVPTGA